MAESRLVGKHGVPDSRSPVETQLLRPERVNSPPTVAASLFCYMDDEVDVWAPGMRKTAMVSLPSDE